jgi:Rrf2 family protein
MRRMGEGVEYALHCVMILGSLPPGGAMAAKDLAEFHGVSESYLLKHLRALAVANVVTSATGPKGGYRLARAAGEITLLDVVEAVDSSDPFFLCTEIRRRGPATLKEPSAYARLCPINRRMLVAEDAWRGALRAQTVAELVADLDTEIDPRNLVAGRAWLTPRIRKAGGVRD